MIDNECCNCSAVMPSSRPGAPVAAPSSSKQFPFSLAEPPRSAIPAEGCPRGPCRRGKLETCCGIGRFARIDCFDQTLTKCRFGCELAGFYDAQELYELITELG